MKAALALALVLATNPALACHHYSSWSYPWPQSCKVTNARSTPRKTWFVKITPPAPSVVVVATDENSERAQAVEALRVELRKAEALKLELHDIGLTKMEDKHGD